MTLWYHYRGQVCYQAMSIPIHQLVSRFASRYMAQKVPLSTAEIREILPRVDWNCDELLMVEWNFPWVPMLALSLRTWIWKGLAQSPSSRLFKHVEETLTITWVPTV